MRKPYASTVRAVLFAVALALLITSAGFASTMAGGSPRHTAAVIRPTASIRINAPRQVTSPEVRSKQVTPISEYTVRPGDTLSITAKRVYGNANTWPALWWINKATIPNPNNLKVGMRLKLIRWHPVLNWLRAAALKAASPSVPAAAVTTAVVNASGRPAYQSVYSLSGLERLWIWAGGPAYLAYRAAHIAECESGGRDNAYNPSGASGIWQILGAPLHWTGSYAWFNPFVNAVAAVWKFRQAGNTFRPWVCQ